MPAFMVCLLTLREFAEGCKILNLIYAYQVTFSTSQVQIGKKIEIFPTKIDNDKLANDKLS